MNAASWRGLILTLLIAAAAGFAGAKLGAMGGQLRTPQPPGQGSVRQAVDTLLDRDFKLTDAQKQQVQQIDARFTRTHNQIWSDINTSNAQLASAVATDLPNGRLENAEDMTLSPDAKTAIQQIQNGVGRLHTESILYVVEVRQVLSPAQRNDFDEHIIMALMRSPP
jgi:hypothetical protein